MLANLDYVWLDIININQNSKDIVKELEILPKIYKHDTHKIINIHNAIRRGWCCYEIAVHNANTKKLSYLAFSKPHLAKLKAAVLEKKSNPELKDTIGIAEPADFRKCNFSVESDRQYVEAAVIEMFKDIESFNEVINTFNDKQVEGWKNLILTDNRNI